MSATTRSLAASSVARRSIFLWLVLLLTTIAYAAPRNVIIMIGDGMGPDTVTAAGAYKFGPSYHDFLGHQMLAMEKLTGHCYATTFSSQGTGYDFTWNNGDKHYVEKDYTDSAAAATALATGVKTYNAAIGVDPEKKPVTLITEIAKQKGMKTGVITTVPFTHATPAGFSAHDENRNNYTAIGHDILFETQPDVVMGAGTPFGTDEKSAYGYMSKEDWQAAVDGKTPYTLIQDRADFLALAKKPAKGKVLGLFRAHNNLAYRMADGSKTDPALPTLAEMSAGTLTALDNPNGFFLMIEGGMIDYAGHANDLSANIGETLGFDEAISTVVAWIQAHGGWENNLLIITADHETGYINSVKTRFAGTLPLMRWGTEGKWGTHTNRPVDVFYQGAGSEKFTEFQKTADDFERGNITYIDDTDIFRVMDAAVQAGHAAVPAGL